MVRIAATVEQKGAKYVYRVYVDGIEQPSQGRTSKKLYRYVLVQKWHGDPDPDDFAARYSTKEKMRGHKIEYGYCAASIPILPHGVRIADHEKKVV